MTTENREIIPPDSNENTQVAERSDNSSKRIAFVNRDGDAISANVETIGSIDDVVASGLWDAPQKDTDDLVNETFIVCDVVAMDGDYGRYFIALCADPDADIENDPNAFFTAPFGGIVAVEKLAKVAGYSAPPELRRNETKPNHLPRKVKLVKRPSRKQGQSPYVDLVDPNWTPEQA